MEVKIMLVKDVMTPHCEYILPDCTLTEAAQKMLDLDTGFLPIGNPEWDKLEGVLTDRDIVTRAIANGLDPNSTTVAQIETSKVLYCYAEDSLEDAVKSMHDQHIYRLVVVTRDKELCGVITLGDIHRHNEHKLAADAAEGITKAA
jgi:CBS domain-containing protein